MGILNPRLVHQIFQGHLGGNHHFLLSLVFYYIVPLIYPFIFGWILALMLNPLVNFFQFKLKLPQMAVRHLIHDLIPGCDGNGHHTVSCEYRS